MLHGNVKTFDEIFKKMGEESTRAVDLVLDGQSLFNSGQKCYFNPELTKGHVRSQNYIDFFFKNISGA